MFYRIHSLYYIYIFLHSKKESTSTTILDALSSNLNFQLCPTDYTSCFPFNFKLTIHSLYCNQSFLLSSTKGL